MACCCIFYLLHTLGPSWWTFYTFESWFPSVNFRWLEVDRFLFYHFPYLTSCKNTHHSRLCHVFSSCYIEFMQRYVSAGTFSTRTWKLIFSLSSVKEPCRNDVITTVLFSSWLRHPCQFQDWNQFVFFAHFFQLRLLVKKKIASTGFPTDFRYPRRDMDSFLLWRKSNANVALIFLLIVHALLIDSLSGCRKIWFLFLY